MNILEFFTISILSAAYAGAAPLNDARNQGVFPGAEVRLEATEKRVIISECRLLANAAPESIEAKASDSLKLETSAWSPESAKPCATGLMLDISDMKGRKAAIARELKLAEQLLNKIPSTDKVSLYLVGKECRKVAQASDVTSRQQLIEQLRKIETEAKGGKLSGIPSDMDSVTMLSMACSSVVADLKAESEVSARYIFLLSDGQDETGGADVAARARHRSEVVNAAKNAEVKVVTVGCYSNNNEYRAGSPWMQTVASETGGWSINAQNGKPLNIPGQDVRNEEDVFFRVAKMYEICKGGFTIDCRKLTEAKDITVILKPATGAPAQLHIPAAIVQPAFVQSAEPQPAEQPAPVDTEREALKQQLATFAGEGATLTEQVKALLALQAAGEIITEANVAAAAAQCEKVLVLLTKLREGDKEKLKQVLSEYEQTAQPAQKEFIQKVNTLLTQAEEPNAAKLLTILGCSGGVLPAATPPTPWGVYGAVGSCIAAVAGFVAVVMLRRRAKKKKAAAAAAAAALKKKPSSPVLCELKNTLTGEVWKICKTRFAIGRADGQDAVIKDSSVSFHHCVIEQGQDGHWGIYDCHSTNKIFAYGKTVETLPLEDGTVFELGSVKLIFNIPNNKK